MYPARFVVLGLALLTLGLGVGCSSSSPEKGDPELGDAGDPITGANSGQNGGDRDANGGSNSNANDGNGGDDSGATNGDDGGGASGKPDAGNNGSTQGDASAGNNGDAGCTPMYNGCDEKYPGVDPDTLCGEIDDGCGNIIDCDPDNDNCTDFNVCGGGGEDNRCGCTPKTCETVVAGGAQCGAALADGCGGEIVSCGDCPGPQDVCNDQLQCTCAPNLQACDGKVCGTASDGCGNAVACGNNGGACLVGDCAANQSVCACPAKETACVGKTGPFTLPNGCQYDCTVGCVPNNVAACQGATCGTATNNCGDIVNCGANAGGCAAGLECVATDYVTGTSVPRRAGGFQGGLCIDNDVANLLGAYAVRTHAFREGGSNTGTSESRAEALSYVTVTTDAAGVKVHMRDVGCSATSRNFPGGTSATSNAPAYTNLPPVDVDLVIAGNAAGNGRWERPIVNNGAGVPTGFTLGVPPGCEGKAGQVVNVPASDTRAWLTDSPLDADTERDCTCPAQDEEALLPKVSAGAANQDCRIVDADADGKPGFTVDANVLFFSASIFNVSISQITWAGSIVPSGFHSAIAIEPDPIQRVVVGCTGSGTLCSNASGVAAGYYDCSCGTGGQFNLIQFVPLDGVVDPGADGWTCSDVISERNNLFSSFGSCTEQSDCPDLTLCTGGKCRPATSNGACSGNASACATELGMVCQNDGACWPSSASCPNPSASTTDACECARPMCQ